MHTIFSWFLLSSFFVAAPYSPGINACGKNHPPASPSPSIRFRFATARQARGELKLTNHQMKNRVVGGSKQFQIKLCALFNLFGSPPTLSWRRFNVSPDEPTGSSYTPSVFFPTETLYNILYFLTSVLIGIQKNRPMGGLILFAQTQFFNQVFVFSYIITFDVCQ